MDRKRKLFEELETRASNKELAGKLGVSVSLLSKIRTGKKNITLDFVCKAKKAYPELESLCQQIWDLSQ